MQHQDQNIQNIFEKLKHHLIRDEQIDALKLLQDMDIKSEMWNNDNYIPTLSSALLVAVCKGHIIMVNKILCESFDSKSDDKFEEFELSKDNPFDINKRKNLKYEKNKDHNNSSNMLNKGWLDYISKKWNNTEYVIDYWIKEKEYKKATYLVYSMIDTRSERLVEIIKNCDNAIKNFIKRILKISYPYNNYLDPNEKKKIDSLLEY